MRHFKYRVLLVYLHFKGVELEIKPSSKLEVIKVEKDQCKSNIFSDPYTYDFLFHVSFYVTVYESKNLFTLNTPSPSKIKEN